MGVKNLWDILDSCKKTLPLHHLQNKRVCIDLSCWMVELQTACKSHSCIKDKVYLRNLFHRLRALLALNCSLIFVTDGSIPAIKLSAYRRRLGSCSEVTRDETNLQKLSRPRNLGSDFSCMIKEAKVLGMALGIPCLDGIEEGEAQCASLNSESLCDGCFTADSDAFLFGAKTVYRHIDLGDGGHVVCYEMVDIERKLGFGRNSLITLALFLGSDYSQGFRGFGPETACQIVKAVGDHSVLQRVASEGLNFAKKNKGLKKQGEVRNYNANKENLLIYKHENNVNEQRSQKDDQILKVIDAYLHPKCHSPDSEAVHRVLFCYPFLWTELQQLCSLFFDWSPEKTDEYILPKIAERDLRRFSNLRASSSELGVKTPLNEIRVKCPVSAIIKPRRVQGKECFEVAWVDNNGIKSSVVPADLIECACPEKIMEYEERMQAKKKNCKPRSKKPGKTAAMDELDLKLQGLLLDIESENNSVSSSTLRQYAVLQENAIPEVIESEFAVPRGSAASQVIDIQCSNLLKTAVPDAIDNNCANLQNNAVPEVIDIASPSPIWACKTSKYPSTVVQQIDVIDLSDSETETSSEHARKARELRLFLASIKRTDEP